MFVDALVSFGGAATVSFGCFSSILIGASSEGEAGETDGSVLGTLLFYRVFSSQHMWRILD